MSGTGEQVSTLVGDRACAGCGFNLAGQPVVREPHYSMLMVRCPECAAVASLQEYPLLGRWAGRIAALLVMVWLAAVLALAVATCGMIFGFSLSTCESASVRYGTVIAERQKAWAIVEAAKVAPTQVAAQTTFNMAVYLSTQPASPWVQIDPTWWKDQDSQAVLASAGGVRGAADWTAFNQLWWAALFVGAAGCLWAVCLCQVRRSRLLVIAIVLLGMAGLLDVIYFSSGPGSRAFVMGGYEIARDVAIRQIGPPVAALATAICFVPLAVGLVVGRPLARLLVRTLLAPRLRVPLSLLWRCDGLEVPGPGSARTQERGRSA